MEVRLYDANGGQTGQAEADEEPGREGVIEHGGVTYIWNQRNAQWRAAGSTTKLKASQAPQAEAVPAKAEKP